jgi:hypothetical protein
MRLTLPPTSWRTSSQMMLRRSWGGRLTLRRVLIPVPADQSSSARTPHTSAGRREGLVNSARRPLPPAPRCASRCSPPPTSTRSPIDRGQAQVGSGSVRRGLSAIRPRDSRSTRVTSVQPDDGRTLSGDEAGVGRWLLRSATAGVLDVHARRCLRSSGLNGRSRGDIANVVLGAAREHRPQRARASRAELLLGDPVVEHDGHMRRHPTSCCRRGHAADSICAAEHLRSHPPDAFQLDLAQIWLLLCPWTTLSTGQVSARHLAASLSRRLFPGPISRIRDPASE